VEATGALQREMRSVHTGGGGQVPPGTVEGLEDDRIKNVPAKDLKAEEGADELVRSDNMRPYLRVAEAVLTKRGLKEAIGEVAELPLEERYIWRVLSALKWAFADFDNVNVVVDRRTLTPGDRQKVAELIKLGDYSWLR
jgi:hypothetical protein